MFDRDYKIDMILWRHLYGAVTNAAYAKPFLQYDLTKSIMFKVANITSFALKPIATPGNSTMYGTEFDGDLGYNGDRLFAGISYGVLFPFAALAHPATRSRSRAARAYGYGPDANGNSNVGDATTAHTIQMRSSWRSSLHSRLACTHAQCRTASAKGGYGQAQSRVKPPRSTYRCDACGHVESKWLGRCPACQEWNSLVEEARHDAPTRAAAVSVADGGAPISIAEVGETSSVGGVTPSERHHRARSRARRRPGCGQHGAPRR